MVERFEAGDVIIKDSTGENHSGSIDPVSNRTNPNPIGEEEKAGSNAKTFARAVKDRDVDVEK